MLGPSYKELRTVPVELCAHALQFRRVPQLRLYLHLKFNHKGLIRYSRGIFKKIAQELRVSEKTVSTHFKNLIFLKWITGNRKAKTFKVVSYKRIAQRYKFRSTKVCYIQERHLNKLSFRAFLWGVVIGYWAQYKKRPRKDIYGKRERRGSTRSTTRANESPSRFRPLANKYIEKVLGIPHSTIVKWKKEADSLGYITIRHRNEESGFGSENYGMYIDTHPERAHLVRSVNGELVFCQPSEIRPELDYKNRKRLKNPSYAPFLFRHSELCGQEAHWLWHDSRCLFNL